MITKTGPLFLVLALLLAAPRAAGQTFDSGSNQSDGALAFPASAGQITFDPKAFDPPLDPDGDNVFHFTTITVPAGTTVRLRADVLGEGRPVVWLASGDVVIDGVVDLSGDAGHQTFQVAAPSVAGAGGFSGGAGGKPGVSEPQAGSGPGGGAAGTEKTLSGGNAGHLTAGRVDNAQQAAAGVAYGNVFLLPSVGGSGGGGGRASETVSGTGGGAGGGAILIASSASIAIHGALRANGGGSSIIGGAGSGGRGSGGAIRLMARRAFGAGVVEVNGSSKGRIRVEAFQRELTRVDAAVTTFSRPGLVFLPADAPRVRVTRVGGVKVRQTPTVSSLDPDARINASKPVDVEIEGRNIPLGTTVRVTLIPENGQSMTLTSSALKGTLESSSATISGVRVPHGFSRFFVFASWTP